jgi:hypothetical protein
VEDERRMIDARVLSYYASQGDVTDPRQFACLLDEVSCDIPDLCRVAQGLMIHVGWAGAYGVELTETRLRDLSIRSVCEQLRFIQSADRRALSVPRAVASRMLGTCRDFALFLCSLLRHHGVPARVRCGFATYLGPNRYEDHWICECWHSDQGRWAMVDAQLDALQRDHLKVTFDSTDLPRGRFLTAAQAWRMCRAGEISADDCGQQAATGLWFMRVNVVRDLLSLAKTEISPWDTWRRLDQAGRALDDDTIAVTDDLARMAMEVDRLGTLVALPLALIGEPTAWKPGV